ncbi:MAG: NTP transferase domain-containing protein [Oligoflexia bacterium]|nr:NTP transferase domain-containing protein [Oligoflexia bacterium]
MKVKVLILAGGLATRLRPLTTNYPKILLEVGDRPFVYHQLRLLALNGFKRVELLLGFKGELVESYIRDNELEKLFNLKITYLYDGPKLLGTGGAVKRSLDRDKGSDSSDMFVVLYGDSYLDYDYQKILNSLDKSCLALMTVYKNDDSFDSSNVVFKDGEILVYDKKNKTQEMKHIDWGFNIFHRDIFLSFHEIYQKEIFDLSEVFQFALKNNCLQGYEVNKRFYEIGSNQGLQELKESKELKELL